jgi:hypothetical protein
MSADWTPPLSHDPKCPACHHAWHLLPCSQTCPCVNPPIPGVL